jgi:hypothetical protein
VHLRYTKRLGRFATTSSDSDFDYSSYFDRLRPLYDSIGLKSSLDIDKFSRHRSSLKRVIEHTNKTIEKSRKFFRRIELRKQSSIIRAKCAPENATIRREYIKCGKISCMQEHGPYYYAYWKDPDSKKLRKKYIGQYVQSSSEESKKTSTNDVYK